MKVAIIPARGGSKRIPGKNIKNFAGKPIIAWSISAAIKTNLFDRVIVSTDDEKIAHVSRKYGAEIPFIRPKKLADDHTGTNEVVKHALLWFAENNQVIEEVCCIYATAPFVTSKSIIEGYKKLIDNNKLFAFSVTTFPFPVQRALRVDSEGSIEAVNPDKIFSRSQDLKEMYHDAGQFYWGRAEAFLEDRVIFSSVSVPVILPRYLVQDIDTREDWDRAELMFKALLQQGVIRE